MSPSSRRPVPPKVVPKAQAGVWKTIMVIDPEVETRKRVVELLRQAARDADANAGPVATRNLAIHEAENGNAAWALVEVVKPDLVVTEILLEGISGLQLLRRLHERYGVDEAPSVLFVTSMSNEVDRYWALRNKAMAYVIKPFDDDFLRSRAIKFFEDRKQGGLDLDANWITD